MSRNNRLRKLAHGEEGFSLTFVTPRITPIPGVLDHNAGPAPQGVFPRVIRLV